MPRTPTTAGAPRSPTHPERSASEASAPGTSSLQAAGKAVEDVALVCGVSEDGQGVEVIRKRGERETLAANSGPAQVATESYRKNWDAVYGRGRKPSLLN